MKKLIKKGERFGKLEVLGFDHEIHHVYENSKRNYKEYFYNCKCSCGKDVVVSEKSLKSGNTKSCGCLNIEKIVERNTTHNLSNNRLYGIYHGIKKRCYNKNSRSYKDYGARGIKMCDSWLKDFRTFYEWASCSGYKDNLTIERIDINKDYCPENCSWIPLGEQAKNTSRSRYYELDGVKHLLGDWCRIYNIEFTCVRRRLERGWNLKKALTFPNRRKLIK